MAACPRSEASRVDCAVKRFASPPQKKGQPQDGIGPWNVGWGRFFSPWIGLSPESPTRAAFPLAQFVRHAIRFPAKFHMLRPDAEPPRGAFACRMLRPGGLRSTVAFSLGDSWGGEDPRRGSAREVPHEPVKSRTKPMERQTPKSGAMAGARRVRGFGVYRSSREGERTSMRSSTGSGPAPTMGPWKRITRTSSSPRATHCSESR